MNVLAPLALLLLCGVLFAGCAEDDPGTGTETGTLRPPVAPDRGAIAGLLIDDVYRPVPNGLVLLQGAGLTATTDEQGQFRFLDLRPGSYVAVANAANHEAAPVNVDVRAGEYTDLEVSARRTFSNDGYIITTQYSIFTACATSAVVVSTVFSCLADSDSYRPGLSVANFTEEGITYLVAEVKLNQADDYIWVLRCDDGSNFGCGEYAYQNISLADDVTKGVYGKVILKLGDNYMGTWQSNPWNNTDKMAALVFYMGQGGRDVTPVAQPVGCTLPPVTNPLNDKPALCREYYGAGHRFAVQGRIILSLFLGEPPMPIDEYQVMGAD